MLKIIPESPQRRTKTYIFDFCKKNIFDQQFEILPFFGNFPPFITGNGDFVKKIGKKSKFWSKMFFFAEIENIGLGPSLWRFWIYF